MAMDSAKRAVEMEPNNAEYQMLYQRLQGGGGWYQSMGGGYGRQNMDMGNFCCELMLCNMLCNGCCCDCA